MPDENDILFARSALKAGYITLDGLSEAVRAQASEKTGDDEDALDAVLLRKSLIKAEDRDRLREAIRKHRKSVDVKGYEVYELIGRGGMGSVFRAKQLSMDRIVALKQLPKIAVGDRTDVQRFLREARLAASLNHKYIVRVFEVGEASDRYFISMEFINGRTLEDLLDKEGAMPAGKALSVARMAAEALDHAHGKGIIHRDLKPGNVMMTAGQGIRIVDFGLAVGYGAISSEKITRAGIILGTPEYIAPEQARKPAEVTSAADIYSLGAILYHMLSGKAPFAGENMLDVLGKVFRREFEPLESARSGLQPEIYALVSDCMASDPEARPTASGFAEAVDAVFTSYPNLQKERAKDMKDTHVISLDAAFPEEEHHAPFSLRGWQAVAVAAFLLSAFFFVVVLVTVMLSGGDDSQEQPAPDQAQGSNSGDATRTPVEVQKDAEAMRMFEEAKAFAKKHGGRKNEVLAKYRRIVEQYPGTMGAFKAKDEIEKAAGRK